MTDIPLSFFRTPMQLGAEYGLRPPTASFTIGNDGVTGITCTPGGVVVIYREGQPEIVVTPGGHAGLAAPRAAAPATAARGARR